MSRKVLINRLAESLNKPVSDIQNMNLTNKQIYLLIQHERLHKFCGAMYRLNDHIKDMSLNEALLKK